MQILSLFDGASTLQLALKNVGITVEKYYASEINKSAIKLSNYHFPNTIHLGDIKNWERWNIDWGKIDLIGSGSPCQDLSRMGKQKGITGKRSSLFFVFVAILKHVRKYNPNVLFIQENVHSASKEDIGIISQQLNISPQMIDSVLFLPQSRKRWFWSNIRVCRDNLFQDAHTCFNLPKKRREIYSRDIIDSGVPNYRIFNCLLAGYVNGYSFKTQKKMKARLQKVKYVPYIIEPERVRLLNKDELCKIQGFPYDYCEILSHLQTSRIMGNAWSLPVIEMIVRQMDQLKGNEK